MRLTEFRPIPGYEGAYEVNPLGMVWSIPRTVDRARVGPIAAGGYFLSPSLDRSGYMYVRLCSRGLHERRYIHQLVAEVFIGPRPEGLVTCHNNGSKTDNRASNLRYGTQAENLADMVKHGSSAQSAKTSCPMGHEYTEDNIDPKFIRGRKCLICKWQNAARQKFIRATRRSITNTMSASLRIADALLKEAA